MKKRLKAKGSVDRWLKRSLQTLEKLQFHDIEVREAEDSITSLDPMGNPFNIEIAPIEDGRVAMDIEFADVDTLKVFKEAATKKKAAPTTPVQHPDGGDGEAMAFDPTAAINTQEVREALDNQGQAEAEASIPVPVDDKPETVTTYEPKAKKKSWLIPAIIGAVVIVAALVAWQVMGNKDDDATPTPSPSAVVTVEPTTADPTPDPNAQPTPDPAATPQPTTDPNAQPQVMMTIDQFNAIQPGMSYEQVRDLVGAEGEALPEMSDPNTGLAAYRWRGHNPDNPSSYAVVTFTNNQMTEKAESAIVP